LFAVPKRILANMASGIDDECGCLGHVKRTRC
jgi:hypothetical protein